LRVLHLLLVFAFLVAFAGTAQAQPAKEPSLSQRVLDSNELAGFEQTDVHTVKDVKAWAKITPGALVNVAARLRFEGFVAAVREDLGAQTKDRGALSIVVQVRSSAAATRELGLQPRDYATESRRLQGHTTRAFRVSGIPGAYGFTATDPSGGFGVNVIFADGPFVYHVGAGWAAGATSPPTKRQVVTAAHHLYKRVHAS